VGEVIEQDFGKIANDKKKEPIETKEVDITKGTPAEPEKEDD